MLFLLKWNTTKLLHEPLGIDVELNTLDLDGRSVALLVPGMASTWLQVGSCIRCIHNLISFDNIEHAS